MRLEIHAEAQSNFDEKATRLSTKLERVIPPVQPEIDPNLHIDVTLKASDLIGSMKHGHRDFLGREDALYFEQGREWIGLSGEAYRDFAELAEAIQKTKSLRDKVSQALIRKLLFEWLERRTNDPQTSGSITDFVLEECAKEVVEDLEVWIPISNLRIQSEFEVGRTLLRTMDRKMFDEWQRQWEEDPKVGEGDLNAIKQGVDRRRSRFQGYAAAIVKLSAEPRRAFEVAVEYANDAAAALRFFSPESQHPELISYCALSGTQHEDHTRYFVIDQEKRIGYASAFRDVSSTLTLSTPDIALLRSNGLDFLTGLMQEAKPTEFQRLTIDAVLLFSRAALAKQVTDKLVYILVALESVFLRDKNEPIGSNIRDRIAFFVGASKEERKEIAEVLSRAYDIRSAYLHHGKPIALKHLADLERFTQISWQSIAKLILVAGKNPQATKESLFRALDDLKWS